MIVFLIPPFESAHRSFFGNFWHDTLHKHDYLEQNDSTAFLDNSMAQRRSIHLRKAGLGITEKA